MLNSRPGGKCGENSCNGNMTGWWKWRWLEAVRLSKLAIELRMNKELKNYRALTRG